MLSRDRDVDVRGEDRLGEVVGDVLGNIERTGLRAEVADPNRLGADAERRHHPVEDAVVVVRRENDDKLRVVFADELAGVRECGAYLVKEILRRSRKIQ